MAILTTKRVSSAGLVPTYASAAGGGDKVKPSDSTFIHVKNGGGGSVTVTVDDTQSRRPDGAFAFNPDLVVVIAPGSNAFIGPIPVSRFRGADGYADVTYSGVSSVTIAALRL